MLLVYMPVFWILLDTSPPSLSFFFFLVRKADLNITIFADCRLNSRHTVSLQVVVPLTNWLWKAKLGHLSNSWSNSDVISTFVSWRGRAPSAVCHHRSVFSQQTREGIWTRTTLCCRGPATQSPNSRALSSHRVCIKALICVLLSLCTCPLNRPEFTVGNSLLRWRTETSHNEAENGGYQQEVSVWQQ